MKMKMCSTWNRIIEGIFLHNESMYVSLVCLIKLEPHLIDFLNNDESFRDQNPGGQDQDLNGKMTRDAYILLDSKTLHNFESTAFLRMLDFLNNVFV